MKPQDRRNLMCGGLVLLAVLLTGSAQAAPLGAIAEERLEPSQLVLQPLFEFERAALTVEGPAGYVDERAFRPGEAIRLALSDSEGEALPDGRYRYSLRLTPGPADSSDVQNGLFFVHEGSGVSRTEQRHQLASIRETLNREEQRRIQAGQQAAAISQYEEGESLAPPASYALTIDGDFALGGYVFKEGKPFIHNYGRSLWANTALGLDALVNVEPWFDVDYDNEGHSNTAVGQRALYSNIEGFANTATGVLALYNNTSGRRNTASGNFALYNNTTGERNTAVGNGVGYNATTGSDNIFLGSGAYGVGGEANTIRIGGTTVGTLRGQQNRAFIAGIRGITTEIADAVTVVIDSAVQLGTVSSSRRAKEEIRDMGEASGRLLELRPVTFRRRQSDSVTGEKPLSYGLIAEEVAAVFPELVTLDDQGEPEAVLYRLLTPMLLNELQKQARLNQEQQLEIARLRSVERELAAIKARLADLEAVEEPTPRVATGRHPQPESGSR